MQLKNLHTAYKSAKPFPHIIIDGFMDSFDAKFCADEISRYNYWGSDTSEYSKKAQIKKYFTPWNHQNIEDIQRDMPLVWKQLQYYNSPPFLKQLEELTGIQGLMADNSFEGGGVHMIQSGGKLSVHTDYAKHPSRDDLYRRINLLIYLNEDWNHEWGGSLQLWDNETKTLISEVQPEMNRAVIFNTTSTSLHGHPHPLNTPEHVSRKSIALYYFTEEAGDDSDTIAATWYNLQ